VAGLWLVDSSAWIFALRPRAFQPIRRRVDELLAENRVVITGVVELELLGGVRSERQFEELRESLAGLRRAEIREADWSGVAEMAFRLRRAGRTVPFTDVMIAFQARRAGAGILHADRDFTVLCGHFQIEQEDYSAAIAGG
jgi:predicted nucleic acid-binding protein